MCATLDEKLLEPDTKFKQLKQEQLKQANLNIKPKQAKT